MGAITIPNPLKDQDTLVALSQEAIEERDRLIDRAVACLARPITSAEEHAAASAVYKACAQLRIAVDKGRERLKAPVLTIGRQIDAAAKEVTVQADEYERKLAVHLRAWEKIVAEEHAAKERARQEEAKRLQAEADARAEAERQKAQAAAEADALPDEPPPEPLPVTDHLPVRIEPAPLAPAPKSAVRSTLKPVVVVDDITKVPLQINGVRLWSALDEDAILVLHKAGITVPGLHVEMREQLQRAGR
jgi:hypothetical protein